MVFGWKKEEVMHRRGSEQSCVSREFSKTSQISVTSDYHGKNKRSQIFKAKRSSVQKKEPKRGLKRRRRAEGMTAAVTTASEV